MDFTILELNPQSSPEDRSSLIPAYLAIWNHPDNLPYLSFTGVAFTELQVAGWFSAHEAANVRYFVAVNQAGTIAAIAVIRQDPVEGFELWGLGAAPEFKRTGGGRALIRHVLKIAGSAGYRAVDTQVFANNAPMLRLLLAEGFMPVRMDYHRGPSGEDLVHMKRMAPV